MKDFLLLPQTAHSAHECENLFEALAKSETIDIYLQLITHNGIPIKLIWGNDVYEIVDQRVKVS